MTSPIDRRTAFKAVAGLAAGGLLAACGSSPSTGNTSGSSTAGSGGSGVSASGPRYGGTAVLAIGQDVKTFNVNYVTDGQAYYIDNNIYSKLAIYDANYTDIHPDLATSWTASKDLKTYTFTLREGVKWHDGKPFTASDVVFTYKDILKYKDKAYTYKLYSNIVDVTAPDDHTVVFTLEQPGGNFLAEIADYYGAYILPEHIYQTGDPFTNPANTKPIGTGPFTFESQVHGGAITLVPNKDYYGTVPYLDKLVFQVVSNRPTAIAGVQSGQITYSTVSPTFGEVASLRSKPGLKVDVTQYPLIQYATLNVDNPILKDRRVRQALSMATDRDEINAQVFAGLATPSKDEYLSWSWSDKPPVRQPEFDIEAAKKLLDEAGYPAKAGGTRFSIGYSAFQTSIFGTVEIPQILKQQWAKIGVDLKVATYDYSLKQEMINTKRDYDIVSSAGIQGPDPSAIATSLITDGSLNISGYADTETDKLFDEGASLGTEDERAAVYQKLWKKLATDMPRLNFAEYVVVRPYQASSHGWPWTEEPMAKGLGGEMYNMVWLDSGRAKR